MSETSQQEREQLVLKHDMLLAAMSLSNSERRKLGVHLSGADLRRQLRAVGFQIVQAGK